MRETHLTRKDDNVGEGTFDSIAWLFSEHIKETDTGEFNYAILYGNEDAPEMVQLYHESQPLVTTPVAWTWTAK